MSFRYPEHPNSNRADPFRDAQGRNPFADQEASGDPPAAATNPYASGNPSGGSYQAARHEQTEQSRGKLLFRLGVVGCGCSVLAGVSVLAAVLTAGIDFGTLLLFAAGPLLLGAAVSWSAWLLARRELRAMRAGAMSVDDRPRARGALALGIGGMLIALLPLAILILALFRALLEAVDG